MLSGLLEQWRSTGGEWSEDKFRLGDVVCAHVVRHSKSVSHSAIVDSLKDKIMSF